MMSVKLRLFSWTGKFSYRIFMALATDPDVTSNNNNVNRRKCIPYLSESKYK